MLRVESLSGRADLFEFARNFPGVPAKLPEIVKLRSFPEIAVTDFVYRLGEEPTVGALRLVSPADITLTVRGQPLAIDRLTGQVSFDGKTWKYAITDGKFADSKAQHTVVFPPVDAKYVRFNPYTEAGNRGPWSSIAEVNMLGASGRHVYISIAEPDEEAA